MTQLGEAVARYHKLLESGPLADLNWAADLQAKMLAAGLRDGTRPVCPFLRPNFLTRRQFATLTKAAETLSAAIDRMGRLALSNATILARLHLLPAEKMLASVDPGYPALAVASLFESQVSGQSVTFTSYSAEAPPGVTYGTALADLFYDSPAVKQFRRQYRLTKIGATKPLAASLLTAYKQFGGKQKPRIGVLDFRPAFQTSEAGESTLLCEELARHGLTAAVVYPDQLEYRGNVLRQADFQIDQMLHAVRVHEFLLRFDLSHPLVRAYRDRAICMVNSFRSEVGHKRAVFALLSDEALTEGFPVAERKAIQQYVPWTRVVAPGNTKYHTKTVDLLDFILANREKLVLKPNDDSGEEHTVHGDRTDDAGWERALRQASRTPYVVQERLAPVREVYPLFRYGVVEMRELQVDVHPHLFLGKVQGCSTCVSDPTVGGFSSVAGLAPTYILEAKG
jgi:hypothetical protein